MHVVIPSTPAMTSRSFPMYHKTDFLTESGATYATRLTHHPHLNDTVPRFECDTTLPSVLFDQRCH